MTLSRLVFRAGCEIRLYRFLIIAFLPTFQKTTFQNLINRDCFKDILITPGNSIQGVKDILITSGNSIQDVKKVRRHYIKIHVCLTYAAYKFFFHFKMMTKTYIAMDKPSIRLTIVNEAKIWFSLVFDTLRVWFFKSGRNS